MIAARAIARRVPRSRSWNVAQLSETAPWPGQISPGTGPKEQGDETSRQVEKRPRSAMRSGRAAREEKEGATRAARSRYVDDDAGALAAVPIDDRDRPAPLL